MKGRNGKRGFSVFTPMVGTLVILITFLIVASMLESEKWNFLGMLESYQTIELTSVSQEAQDRAVATIRDQVLTDLGEHYYLDVPQCNNSGLKDAGFDLNPCENASLHTLKEGTFARVTGISLSKSYLDTLVKRIVSKYELIRINTNLCSDCNTDENGNKVCTTVRTDEERKSESVSVTFTNQGCKCKIGNGKEFDCTCCLNPMDTITGTELMGCDVDTNNLPQDFSDLDYSCQDGRVKIKVDFTKQDIANAPIATIRANTSQYTEMKIYLPRQEKEFVTNDPLGFYALVTSMLFENFTLMDPAWHNAGGRPNHDGLVNYGYIGKSHHDGYGNGSQWYHYKYAWQKRVPGTETSPYVWNMSDSFNFSNGDDSDSPPVDLWKEIDPYLDKLKESGFNKGFGVKELVLGSIKDTLAEYFSGGWFLGGFTGLGNKMKRPEKITIDSTTEAVEQEPSNAIYLCLNENNCKKKLSLTNDGKNFILLNTTAEYDKKFLTKTGQNPEGPLADATQALVNHLANNPTLKASAGYGTDDTIKINLTVNSEQYYTCNETTGGDNWECGQYVGEYVPVKAGEDYLVSIKNGPWYLTGVVNYTCHTCVLYNVRETFTLRRNTHKNLDDPNNKTVFKAVYNRWAINYDTGENTIWKDSGLTDSTIIDYQSSNYPIHLRKCTYYCTADSNNEKECNYECHWENQYPNW